MKHLLAFAAIALMASAALASPRDLNNKSFNELPVLAVGSVASGDYLPVYDVSTRLVKKVDATVLAGAASGQPTIRTAVDAVASGQTSKAVTVTGITAASRCVAMFNEVTTNAVYVRAVVPTANTATVTISADPGASNADLTVICAN